MKESIQITDTDYIESHKLYCKGNALTPSRFWEYRLVNITRPYNEDDLKNFSEMNLTNAILNHDGVSLSLLIN